MTTYAAAADEVRASEPRLPDDTPLYWDGSPLAWVCLYCQFGELHPHYLGVTQIEEPTAPHREWDDDSWFWCEHVDLSVCRVEDTDLNPAKRREQMLDAANDLFAGRGLRRGLGRGHRAQEVIPPRRQATRREPVTLTARFKGCIPSCRRAGARQKPAPADEVGRALLRSGRAAQ